MSSRQINDDGSQMKKETEKNSSWPDLPTPRQGLRSGQALSSGFGFATLLLLQDPKSPSSTHSKSWVCNPSPALPHDTEQADQYQVLSLTQSTVGTSCINTADGNFETSGSDGIFISL